MPEEAALFTAEELAGTEVAGAVAADTIGAEAVGSTVGADVATGAAADTVLEGGVGPTVEGAAAPAVAGTLGAGTVLEGGVGPTVEGAAAPAVAGTLGADAIATGLPAVESGAAPTAGLQPVDPAITSTINSGATSTGAASLPGGGGADYSIFTGDTPTDVPNPLADETIAPAADSPVVTPPTKNPLQKAADTALKYGPLALAGAGALTNRKASTALPQQLASLGQPQRDAATGLIAAYQSGKLPDAQEAAFAQAERDAIAKVRQYYAKAGLSDSSMAVGQESDIHAQFQAKRQEALQTMLTTGLDTLNITDQNTRAAILTELQINKDTAAQTQAFLNATGQLAARLPQVTKAAA